MGTHATLLRRLDEIRAAIKGLEEGDFAGRHRLESAADRVRSALSQLDQGEATKTAWEIQAVRALEEMGIAVPTVNIDTARSQASDPESVLQSFAGGCLCV